MFNREHVCKRCLRNVDENCAKNSDFVNNIFLMLILDHQLWDRTQPKA